MEQLVFAVAYLRLHDICHRDLKTANILYTTINNIELYENAASKKNPITAYLYGLSQHTPSVYWIFKLADFGLAGHNEISNGIGWATVGYRPPEMFVPATDQLKWDFYALAAVWFDLDGRLGFLKNVPAIDALGETVKSMLFIHYVESFF